MENRGSAQPTGGLGLNRQVDLKNLHVQSVSLGWKIRNFFKHGYRSAGQLAAADFTGRVFGLTTLRPSLSGMVYRADLARLAPEQLRKLRELLASNIDVRLLTAHFGGQVLDYGVLSRRVVTDAGVAYIVDAFQNLTELENMKYHGFGTGSTAEAASQTALITELTTQYVSDVRPTGSTTEASAAVYRTVATLSPDSGGTIAVTEHGVFSASSAGTLLDRSVFSAVNLVASSDSLQATYDLTLSSGG
jgi:hypothetical protein